MYGSRPSLRFHSIPDTLQLNENNLTFNLSYKTSSPIFSEGCPYILIQQHTDPLLQHVPNPAAIIVWNKLIIHRLRTTMTPGLSGYRSGRILHNSGTTAH